MALHPRDLLRAALPAGHERDRLIELVTIGLAFREQQRGRRPGVLRRRVVEIVGAMQDPTFDALLVELELDALRHRLGGDSPILRVDRAEEVIRYVERGIEREAGFRRLRNVAQLRKARASLRREKAR